LTNSSSAEISSLPFFDKRTSNGNGKPVAIFVMRVEIGDGVFGFINAGGTLLKDERNLF
jgi:hypothetical protein